MSDMGKILHDEFAPQGYEFSTKVPAYCMIKFASFFSKEIAGVLPLWGKERHFNNTPSKEMLGINYRPINTALIEMVN